MEMEISTLCISRNSQANLELVCNRTPVALIVGETFASFWYFTVSQASFWSGCLRGCWKLATSQCNLLTFPQGKEQKLPEMSWPCLRSWLFSWIGPSEGRPCRLVHLTLPAHATPGFSRSLPGKAHFPHPEGLPEIFMLTSFYFEIQIFHNTLVISDPGEEKVASSKINTLSN